MKKAVIYIRVSTEEQAKHGFSIETQLKTCQELQKDKVIQLYKHSLKKVKVQKTSTAMKFKND